MVDIGEALIRAGSRRLNMACRVGYNSMSSLQSSASDAWMARFPVWSGPQCDWADPEFVFGNFGAGLAVSGADNGANAVTITAASIEPSSGFMHPLYFEGGAKTITLQPGAWARTIPANIIIPAGTQFWLRLFLSVPASGSVWQSEYYYANQGGVVTVSPTDQTLSGAISNSNGIRHAFPPVKVMATPLGGVAAKSIGIMGDSISVGYNDTGPQRDVGWVCRGIGLSYPYAHFGQGGFSFGSANPAGNSLSRSRKYTRDLLFEGLTHVIAQLGTNDINPTQNLTAEQLQSIVVAYNDELSKRGVKLIPCTILPRTDAANSGGFYPGDSQTQRDRRATYNAWVKSDPFGNGFFDADSFAADPGDNNRWRSDLGSPSSDGLHPSAAIHEAVGNGFSAALQNLIT